MKIKSFDNQISLPHNGSHSPRNSKEKINAKKDIKYKTELCKNFSEKQTCPYGKKCQFAHGKHELKTITPCNNYKKTPCLSFNQNFYCKYGNRCNFSHDERKFYEIERSYYTYKLMIYHYEVRNRNDNRRLKVFENICSNTNNYILTIICKNNVSINTSRLLINLFGENCF